MKKESIAVIFCFLSLTIVSCFSTNNVPQNKVVADAMMSLKEALPIHLEGLGNVNEVDYDGNNVIFRMWIQEDDSYGLNVSKISSNQALARKIISAQIGMMDKNAKEAIKSIAGQSFGLKVLIGGSNSSRDGVINLSSDDLKLALANAQIKSADDFSLEMVAMTTRLILPARVDQITTWTDTRLTETTFEYVYRIDDANINLANADMEMLKQEKLMMLTQNMDVMSKVVRCCKSTHRNLVYKYIGNNTNKIIAVVLTPMDLDNL